MIAGFRNEPVAELRLASTRSELSEALHALDRELPLAVPLLVGDARRDGDGLISVDPCSPDRVVAVAATASADDVEMAVAAATVAATTWGRETPERRAAVLTEAASILRARRPRLTALIVRESAKPWVEADADICEAIDFLEYYARGAVELSHASDVVSLPGERNTLRWMPRGVAAVIAPWNFPIAIACGMVAAALATGNAVVLKPAEQTPACAWEIVRALRDAGAPPGAINLVCGEGDVGAALVAHPGVHIIAFTGSGAVGLEIMQTAARLGDGQQHLKTVVAEMGGKNCILVDSDADLDDAVLGIVHSAFGFAGQKCSATSRVLAHEAIAGTLAERLAGAVTALRVGPAERFSCDLAALIDEEAQQRVERYVAIGERDGTVAARTAEIPPSGWFCAPTLLTDVRADSAVLHEEIFGPVLALESISSMDEACERVEALPFALTGGLYSRNPATVAAIAARMPVGNFYVNRATTGAMVARQPFGGNRLSGTGTKAGGPGYLLRFVEPRVTTENTVRHGLVV